MPNFSHSFTSVWPNLRFVFWSATCLRLRLCTAACCPMCQLLPFNMVRHTDGSHCWQPMSLWNVRSHKSELWVDWSLLQNFVKPLYQNNCYISTHFTYVCIYTHTHIRSFHSTLLYCIIILYYYTVLLYCIIIYCWIHAVTAPMYVFDEENLASFHW